jgi:hypothetical protein
MAIQKSPLGLLASHSLVRPFISPLTAIRLLGGKVTPIATKKTTSLDLFAAVSRSAKKLRR